MIKKCFFGREKFQAFFERIYEISLMGLNFGMGGDFRNSGERQIVRRFLVGSGKPQVIFDIGAHTGEFACEVKSIVNNVELHCFEPSSLSFAKLKENLCDDKRVKAYNFGFGDRDETVDLYFNTGMSVFASVYKMSLNAEGGKIEKSEKITLKRLDDFCRENNITHIDFVKIDVEGNEYNVLKGAGKLLDTQAIDYIQFEFGGCDIDSRVFFRDFFHLLGPKYRIYRILQDGLAPVENYKHIYEVFLTTNYIAISRSL